MAESNLDKYKSIARSAVKKTPQGLNIGSEFEVYKGVDAESQRRLGVTIIPDSKSIDTLHSLSQNILRRAGESGAKVLIAGEGFPYHITVQEIRKNDFITGYEETKLRNLIEKGIKGMIVGLPIHLDYMFIDKKGNVVLASKQIPPDIIDARDKIRCIGKQEGFEPLPIENILHLTLARLLKLPDDPTNYYKMKGIRPIINLYPLSITGRTTIQITSKLLNNEIDLQQPR